MKLMTKDKSPGPWNSSSPFLTQLALKLLMLLKNLD